MKPHYTNTCFECGQAMPADAWEADKVNDFTDEELEVINRVFMEIAMQWSSSGRSNAARIGKKAQAILEARNPINQQKGNK